MLRKSLHFPLLGAPLLFAACSGDPEPQTPDPAVLIIDRATLDFGEVEVGRSSAEYLFTVRNASPTAVESVSMEVDSPAFVIATNTCERFLDAGMECEVRVRFQPRTAGPFEGRLRVQGAPDVDSAVLEGTAVAWVEVERLAMGARIVGGDDEWSCDQPCRVAVRESQLTLRPAPSGFPTWGGDCASATGATCTLTMDGTKRVSLEALAPIYAWEVRRPYHVYNVAALPDGDVVIQEIGRVTRLSSTGQERWSVSVSGVTELATDSSGNIYTVGYSGEVKKLDANGQEQWAYAPSGLSSSWHGLAVSPGGHVYVLLSLGDLTNARQQRLVALSQQGGERWSQLFDEGQYNYASSIGVSAQGEVYFSGSVFNRHATSGELVFVKGYFRKLSAEGVWLWETSDSWSSFAVNAQGMTSAIFTNTQAPGGYSVRWIDEAGKPQWDTTPTTGPGIVNTQGFTPDGTLLLGGYEQLAGGATGRGWFSAFNPQTRTAGAATYVETSTGGGPVRVNGLARTPGGHVAVAGGFGNTTEQGEGFVRLYDPRTLSTSP